MQRRSWFARSGMRPTPSCGHEGIEVADFVQDLYSEATMSRLNPTFRKRSISCVVLFVLAVLPSSFAQTAPLLAPDLRTKIDDIAHHVLGTTGVPSASPAVVRSEERRLGKECG